jgi:hypothetical protein
MAPVAGQDTNKINVKENIYIRMHERNGEGNAG